LLLALLRWSQTSTTTRPAPVISVS
jgi:hypothetical protein